MPQWSVYMLRCADDSLYTGVAIDVEVRVTKHNEGKASKYTRSKLPVELVYCEPAASHGDALRREYAIKQLPVKLKQQLLSSAGNALHASSGSG
ncbi:MAG: GIY-YIG nuclease family protein [Pseudomonadota bacterium]